MDHSFFRCKQVLVVDDCAPVRSSIKAMLQQMGFEAIHLARDANEAILKCHEIPFDFILCDFNLGECKDGYQLFEALKQQQLLAPLGCFIVISAENQRQIVHGVIELQPDDYILKPFSYPLLEERIIRAVKTRIALRKVHLNIFEHNYADAILECDKSVHSKPEFALHALRLKGELLLKTGQYAKAEQFYQQVLQQYKDNAWARLGHALACFYQQRWDDTELQLADLTQFDNTRVEALDWLSRLYVKYGRYQIAHDTLYQAVLLSPKNITRQKTLSNLSAIIGDKAAAARINGKLVAAARHSIYDVADNYLNHARALVDTAYCSNVLERAVILQNASKLVDSLHKRFDVEQIKQETTLLRSRILAARGELQQARELIATLPGLTDNPLTIDSCMDAAKAYFELGDIFASQFYIDKLNQYLATDDFLTETQRIMLTMEQARHEELKTKIRQINDEATEAYQQGFYGKAAELFCETFDYMPTNPALALNLLQAMSKGAGLTPLTQRYSKAAVKLLLKSELPPLSRKRFEKYWQTLQQMHPELTLKRREIVADTTRN